MHCVRLELGPYKPQAGTLTTRLLCSDKKQIKKFLKILILFPLHTTISKLNHYGRSIFSLIHLDHASLHEALKFLCPFVIIFRRIIAFNLVKNHTFVVFIHFDLTLWLYSGNIKAKRLFWLIKSSNLGL